MSNYFTGSQVAAAGENLSFEVNNDVIQSIAEALAFTVTKGNSTVLNIIGLDGLKDSFSYALSVVLAVDSGSKPIHDPVPEFFTDLFMPLNSMYRGVRIHVSELKPMDRPSVYTTFTNVMQSIGVSMGRPNRVDPYGTSKVAQYGIKNYDGVDMLVGVERDNVSLEELVVRSMLNVSAMEQDKLDRILGHLDLMYVSVDELTRNWACSLPVGNVALAK